TWEVMLAIDEICCNIIAHARPLGGQHALYLTWQDEPEAVTIFVSDKGIPFNPLLPCTEEKEVLEENRRLGGMGPHLIEKMLDKVSYRRENGFNHLCLCKFKSRRNNRCACSSRKKTTEKTAE
ncbi:MAG TPA: ATP-binding protein, partial [bacterium]|nr:ATP-binding protein [bacterium]